MSSMIRFHRYPFSEFGRVLEDALSARPWPSPLVADVTFSAPQRVYSFRPRVDVRESKDDGTITATFELPGLKSEDVSVDLRQDTLTVSGAPTSSASREQDGYTVRERGYGKFSQTLQLPFGTKPEDVKAKLENGLLTVTFPKTTPEQQPRRIAIQ